MEITKDKEDFVKTLMVQAIETGMEDIYKKHSYCVVISKIVRCTIKLRHSVIGDVEFFRKYLYFNKVLGSEYHLDYLGEDKGVDDILKFDTETVRRLFELNQDLDNYIGSVADGLKFTEIDLSEA